MSVKHDSRKLPKLKDVYALYENDDTLPDFVEAADHLLEYDKFLSRWDTIQLMILVGTSIEDSYETLTYYHRAKAKYLNWKGNYSTISEEKALQAIKEKLHQLWEVVEEERLAWEKANGNWEDLEEMERQPDVIPPGAVLVEVDDDMDDDVHDGEAEMENMVKESTAHDESHNKNLQIRTKPSKLDGRAYIAFRRSCL